MALTIEVEFLLERFEGSDGHDGTPPEWPPAPARLFAALVAGCQADHREALEWLERQGAPVIYAGSSQRSGPHPRWLVTNRLEPKGGSAHHPARQNVQRARWRRWLDEPRVAYTWPNAAPDPPVVEALEDAAARVPYLGRPTSPVIAWAHSGDPVVTDRMRRWEAREAPTLTGNRLRVPYPAFLEDLSMAFAEDRHVDPPVRQDYDVAAEEASAEPVHHLSPWRHLVSLPLVSRAHIPGERALELTSALRDAILDLVGSDVAPAISGHGAEAPHVAYWALPFTGHDQADGHVLAVAVAAPDAGAETLRQLRDALTLPDRQRGIRLRNVRGFGVLEFGDVGSLGRGVPWGARSERWIGTVSRGTGRPTRLWRTVLPAVLDQSPSRRLDEREAALLSVTNAGFPEPEAVVCRREPFRRGDLHLRPSRTIRRRGDRIRPYRHLLIRFREPVRGPVAVGALRHFGLGLCAPEDDTAEASDDA